MDTEVRIRESLDRELSEAGRPPLGSIVADAVAAGRRRRRWRRGAVVASGAGALTVMVVTALLLRPASTVGPVPPGDPTTAARKAATGEAVIALLLDLLPPGGEVAEVEHFTDRGVAAGSLLYDDGHGPATVSAGVADHQNEGSGAFAGMGCPPDAEGFTCRHRVTPDGVEVRVTTMGPYDCSDRKCSIKDVRVEIRRPDGTFVTVDSYNGPFGHDRAATRAETLLDADRMLAMATDPRWGLTMDAALVDGAAARIRAVR